MRQIAGIIIVFILAANMAGAAWKTNPDTGIRDYYEASISPTDANITLTDITTNNVSITKHGFCPKAPNDATKFLDGTAAWDTVKDSDLSFSDITTNDVSSSAHGLCPKRSAGSDKVLRGNSGGVGAMWGYVAESEITFTDITTNDVSTSKHGFVPKAPNDTSKFLRGDATWAAPTGTGNGYALQGGSDTAFSPVDSTPLYFGGMTQLAPNSAQSVRRIYVPKAGTVKAAIVWWDANGAAGSNENITMTVRLNATSGEDIETIGNTAATKIFDNYAMTLAVAAGDYLEFKISGVSWATNPTNVRVWGTIYIE